MDGRTEMSYRNGMESDETKRNEIQWIESKCGSCAHFGSSGKRAIGQPTAIVRCGPLGTEPNPTCQTLNSILCTIICDKRRDKTHACLSYPWILYDAVRKILTGQAVLRFVRWFVCLQRIHPSNAEGG
mmetsp:Transcript_9305/g.27773  ORF Transcript_9305/g.27773 Transcript_9305/m.27773 type:complete len:128 (-) Transcript_9305:174-557(-)